MFVMQYLLVEGTKYCRALLYLVVVGSDENAHDAIVSMFASSTTSALTIFAHYCEPNPTDPMGLRSKQQYRDISTLATTPPSTTQS